MGRRRFFHPMIAAVAAAGLLLSGATGADPRTPVAAPGEPPPFLGTTVIGDGRLLAAVDAYGDLVDLRAPGPAGAARISNPFARQVAGSVAPDTGIVPAAGAEQGPLLPLWRATDLRQRYLPGTNVLLTRARVGGVRLSILDAAHGERLARRIVARARPGQALRLVLGLNLAPAARVRCRSRPAAVRRQGAAGRVRLAWRGRGELRVSLSCAFAARPLRADRVLRAAVAGERRWLAHRRPLDAAAPGWARRMYRRSLLVLRALADSRSGALVAGARDGWAYVWPRDAGTGAIAMRAAGYPALAGRVVGFLSRLDLSTGARFRGDGSAVRDGRPLAGDARGWVAAAKRALRPAPAGRDTPAFAPRFAAAWRDRGDYRERADDRGDYLANAIAAGAPGGRIRRLFGSARGLTRRAGDPDYGLDPAGAWAVRPFPRPSLFGIVRRTLRSPALGAHRLGFGGPGWPGDGDWTAPAAWCAWSLAALGDRAAALRMLAILRRDQTAAGAIPERVGAGGVPRSTTPLGWAHAFAVLALRTLYPAR